MERQNIEIDTSSFNTEISGRTGSENKNRSPGILKPNKIRYFESVRRYSKKFYTSIHEKYFSRGNMDSRDILKFVNFIYHEYKVKM